MIYLDNAATTPMSAVALAEMTKVMQETHGNPSSIHSHGRHAGKLLREARQELAHLLGTKPQRIFLTIQLLSAIVSAIKKEENTSSRQLLSTILSLKPLIILFNILALKQPSSNQ